MKPKTYMLITAALLAVVAILHAARVVLQLPVQIGAWDLPMWMSIAGAFVTGTLSTWGFAIARK